MKLRQLFAEDGVALAPLLTEYLSESDDDITCFSCRDTALEVLRKEMFELVLTDIVLTDESHTDLAAPKVTQQTAAWATGCI